MTFWSCLFHCIFIKLIFPFQYSQVSIETSYITMASFEAAQAASAGKLLEKSLFLTVLLIVHRTKPACFYCIHVQYNVHIHVQYKPSCKIRFYFLSRKFSNLKGENQTKNKKAMAKIRYPSPKYKKEVTRSHQFLKFL